jgi:hypothetical protein
MGAEPAFAYTRVELVKDAGLQRQAFGRTTKSLFVPTNGLYGSL